MGRYALGFYRKTGIGGLIAAAAPRGPSRESVMPQPSSGRAAVDFYVVTNAGRLVIEVFG